MTREELPVNYAKAIYEMALEEWSAWLEALSQHLMQDRMLAQLLSDDKVSPAEKHRQLQAALPAHVSPKFRQFVGLLAEKGQMAVLPELMAAFGQMARFGPEQQLAYITSAVELPVDQRTQLEAMLRRRHGAALQFRYSVDPALVGGLRVRVGDTVIDGSVAGKLQMLHDQLVSR